MKHRAFVGEDLFADGIGYVVVARQKSEDRYEVGAFLLDVFCLGVKDATFIAGPDAPPLDELLKKFFRDDPYQEYDGAYGRKLIESAVDYAKSLGLAPHRDYKLGARVFGGCRAEDCSETFTFGKDGRPFFIQGPFVSDAAAERIVNVLTARLGEDNFDVLLEASMEMDGTENYGPGSMNLFPCESGERFREAKELSPEMEEFVMEFLENTKGSGNECTIFEPFNHLADALTVFLPEKIEAFDEEDLNATFLPILLTWNYLTSGLPLEEYRASLPAEIGPLIDLLAEMPDFPHLLESLRDLPVDSFLLHHFRIVEDKQEPCGYRLLILAGLLSEQDENAYTAPAD
jgi:hypothetical protein